MAKRNDVSNIYVFITFYFFFFRLRDERLHFNLNLEVQLLLKQGQIEVGKCDFVPDYTESLLIHRSAVENLNAVIKVSCRFVSVVELYWGWGWGGVGKGESIDLKFWQTIGLKNPNTQIELYYNYCKQY